MKEYKCIVKCRNKHNIIDAYVLEDSLGHYVKVTANELKKAIKQNRVYLSNLTLTSDDRLIDKTTIRPKDTQDQNELQQKMEDLVSKARMTGTLMELASACKHKVYLISNGDKTEHILYIPKDVTNMNKFGCISELERMFANVSGDDYLADSYYNVCSSLCGTLKVVGGWNVATMCGMFSMYSLKHLDLTRFSTSNIQDFSHAFEYSRIDNIEFGNFDTHKALNMSSMFNGVYTVSLDLSTFDTSRVLDMSGMFQSCTIYKGLNLSSFNTERVTNMENMFNRCSVSSLSLESFNTDNVRVFDQMFEKCRAKIIDISTFRVNKDLPVETFAIFSDLDTDTVIYVNDNTLKKMLHNKYKTE